MDVFQMLCFVPLVAASYQDVRSRAVDDVWWWAILGIGTVNAFLGGTEALSWTLSSVALCVSALTGGRIQMLALCTGSVTWALCASAFGFREEYLPYVIEPVFLLVYYLLYRAGIVAGGADVKCLMVLSVAVPANDIFQGYLALVFAPSVCILSAAAVMLSVAGGAVIIARGGLGAFPNYHIPSDRFDPTFMILAEDPRGMDPMDYCRTTAAGRSVLVSPLFPFVAYLTAGFVVWHIWGIAI